MTFRTRMFLALGLALLTLVVGLAPALRSASEGVAAAPRVPGELRVLSAWDAARADAFAAGDVAALRALYAPGSVTGRRDVEVLRGYVDRGLVVRGLRMQLLAWEVTLSGPGRIRLVVTDRLQGAVVVGRAARDPTAVRLPADRASRRLITFVRRAGAWVVAEVSAAAPP